MLRHPLPLSRIICKMQKRTSTRIPRSGRGMRLGWRQIGQPAFFFDCATRLPPPPGGKAARLLT